MVLPSLGLGGAERQGFFLARHLLQVERADVSLVGMSQFDALAEHCARIGLPYEYFETTHRYRSRLGQLNDLRRWISFVRQRRASILLPYCMFQNVMCGLTWRLTGAKVCIWNQRDEGRSRLEPWIERMAVLQTPRFISNSTHGARFVTDDLRVPADRVHVVQNGIELPGAEAVTEDWRARAGIPADAFTACMVANLHGKKDHATLISAWARVVEQLTPRLGVPHLLLAGADGDQSDALREQVRSMGLAGKVHFLGEVRHVTDLLKVIDLAVFSSVAEGVPNAVLEAMAHGRPVVATDYPGIREAVGANVALLSNPGSAEDLADKIVTSALDPDLRARGGREGRQRIVECFGIERMAGNMTDIIRGEWQRRAPRSARHPDAGVRSDFTGAISRPDDNV